MRAILVACLMCASVTGQNPLYVDPVRGADQLGGGSAASPFRTLTFAVKQVPAAGPATFYLRPATYSAASGEQWPIPIPDQCTIEADPALVPVGARLASFEASPVSLAMFELTPGAVSTVVLRNLKLTGNMWYGVHMIVRSGTVLATLLVEDCTIAQQHCLDVQVNTAAAVKVTVLRSRFTGVDSCVIVHTQGPPGSIVDLAVDRSTFVDGISGNIVLDGGVAGTLSATVRASQLRSGVRYGLVTNGSNGATIKTRIEHCLLFDSGNNVIGGGISNGAIYDLLGNGGIPAQHVVVNSIFANNMSDALLGTGANYTWGNNLVKQANLATLGGNRTGAAGFVKSADNDFHLLPTSVCVDKGNPSHTTLVTDFDGEPRLSPWAGMAPDLGPDEMFVGATFSTDGARVGQPYLLRTTWTPGAPFALVLGTAAVPSSFGLGLVHLAGQILDIGLAGTCNAAGLGEATLLVPNNPGLAGLEVFWQSVTSTPPYLGVNAKRTLVLMP
jgi:hypothetical protein